LPKEKESLRTEQNLSPVSRAFVVATAMICGAAVMEVELLGARVLSPWFGVSFFVWTALITITLLSLAAGYYAGGRLADKRASLKTLSLLVGASGLFLLAVPLLRTVVLKTTVQLGIRMGALAAGAILFGPPLMLLGTITPFAVKLILKDLREAGRTVGRLSALSTFGSFAGTIATGFWIIPALHVDQIAAGTAMILLFLAGALWAGGRGTKLALLLFIPGLFFLKEPPLADIVQASGTRARVVSRVESFYGQISVADYSFGERHTREMLIDGIIQGGIDVNSGDPIYPFTYHLEQAALSLNPDAKKALVIGLGPATMSNRLEKYGISGTVVEIDPKVVGLAERYFNFKPGKFQVAVEDGRTFLDRTKERYDIILLDAFSAENEPAHLLTLEAFEAVRRILNPGGVLAINLSGLTPGAGTEDKVVDTVVRTLNKVFPKTLVHHSQFAGAGQITNFTLVAALPGDPPNKTFSPLPVHPFAEAGVNGFLESSYNTASKDGPVYTDGWAPVEAQSASTKILWRRNEIAATPAEILLN
jgi:spermidine synthase